MSPRALEMGPTGCPETSVSNYQSTPRNVPQERILQLFVIFQLLVHSGVLFCVVLCRDDRWKVYNSSQYPRMSVYLCMELYTEQQFEFCCPDSCILSKMKNNPKCFSRQRLLCSKENKYYWFTYVKENAEALVVATKEIGLEVNADKTKYMVTSREQTAGLSHTMKVDNRSIEWVEEFKYLGTALTNQNSIQE